VKHQARAQERPEHLLDWVGPYDIDELQPWFLDLRAFAPIEHEDRTTRGNRRKQLRARLVEILGNYAQFDERRFTSDRRGGGFFIHRVARERWNIPIALPPIDGAPRGT
jgi:hypothetical protein